MAFAAQPTKQPTERVLGSGPISGSPSTSAIAQAATPAGAYGRRHVLSRPVAMRSARPGLATAKAERVVAGSKTIEVARVRITEAGRRALA
jgi:hypothetical protein